MEKRNLQDIAVDADAFQGLDIAPRERILAPWLKTQSINLISGWRGVGKSWFALSLCDAISRGEPFGPWTVESPVHSLYVDAEMAAADMQERLAILDRAATDERMFRFNIYSDAYANDLGSSRASLRSPMWRKEIREYLLQSELKLIVLDNIASLAPGLDENSKKDWDPINQWLLELRFSGISSILLHHVNKAGDQRGTSAREDNLDVSINLIQPPDYTPDQGARFTVRFSKTRIATSDLPMLQDIEFQLMEVDGRVRWSFSNARKRNKVEILRMLDEGLAQSDIATALGVDKGYVSRVKTQAIKEGLLSQKGKLTQGGLCEVYPTQEGQEFSQPT